MLLLFICTSCKDRSSKGASDAQQKDTTVGIISTVHSDPPQIPTTIERIRQLYDSTITYLSEAKMDSVSFTYRCGDEKSGKISFYSYQGTLRLITHKYHEYDHHHAEDQFFTIDSILYFIFKSQTLWSFESGPDGSTKDDVTEHRTYLLNQKPVQCLKKEFVIHSESPGSINPKNGGSKNVTCPSNLVEEFKAIWSYRHETAHDCPELKVKI